MWDIIVKKHECNEDLLFSFKGFDYFIFSPNYKIFLQNFYKKKF